MRKILIGCFLVLFALPLFASKGKQVERMMDSAEVYKEVMNIPEGIPKDLMEKAECVVIVPSVKKAALGIGGNYGKGVISCRLKEKWSPPVMVIMTGGSYGLQIGGSSTDIILLIMNKQGVNKLLESKVTLGVDASAAAGPKGRTASAATDVQMRAEILCYARSRGLFAGIAIDGSVLKPDGDDNEDLYGKKVDPRLLLLQGGDYPSYSTELMDLLNQY